MEVIRAAVAQLARAHEPKVSVIVKEVDRRQRPPPTRPSILL